MTTQKARPVDPARNFKFAVNIENFGSAGFQKVSGLKDTSEVIEYREGTDPITPRKLMGQIKFENITLEKGLSNSQDFVNWRKDVVQILSSGNLAPDGVPDDVVRRDMEIVLADMHGQFQWVWDVYAAWPTEQETNEMNASANEVLIEKLVIAHEGYEKTLVAAGTG